VCGGGLLITKRNKFLHLMKELYLSWLVWVVSENYSFWTCYNTLIKSPYSLRFFKPFFEGFLDTPQIIKIFDNYESWNLCPRFKTGAADSPASDKRSARIRKTKKMEN
jgi:hypothetical protein